MFVGLFVCNGNVMHTQSHTQTHVAHMRHNDSQIKDLLFVCIFCNSSVHFNCVCLSKINVEAINISIIIRTHKYLLEIQTHTHTDACLLHVCTPNV